MESIALPDKHIPARFCKCDRCIAHWIAHDVKKSPVILASQRARKAGHSKKKGAAEAEKKAIEERRSALMAGFFKKKEG